MHTFHPKSLVWTREPQAFEISENKITITTVPHTDLKQSMCFWAYRTKKELSIVRHGEIILYKPDLILYFHPVITPHCALSRQSAHPAN